MSSKILLTALLPYVFLGFLPSAFAQGGSRTPPPQAIHDPSRLSESSETPGIDFQSYDKSPLKFSTTTSYILVPVVVIDKEGKHVGGLTRDDFQVTENGKDQKVSSLEEIKATSGTLPRPARIAGNVVTNQIPVDAAPRELVIVALDMLNTPFLEQARARKVLISYLSDTIDPSGVYQLVAVENNGLRILHDYTQDTEALITTLKAVRSQFNTLDTINEEAMRGVRTDPGPTTVRSIAVDPDTNRPEIESMESFLNTRGEAPTAQMKEGAAANSTLLAFQQIAERASGIPGRKSLVWITGSLPFSIDPGSASVNTGMSFEAYQHTMQLLQDQLIAVYPVDARGLTLTQPDASMHLSRTENAQAATLLSDQSNRLLDTMNTMHALADMTGGHAYVNTNDTGGAIREAVRDGSTYYMLSYPLDKGDRRQGWRKINVKVKDYKVRARRGYFLTQATIEPLRTARYDIDNALKSPLDYTGLPVRIILDHPVPSGEKRKLTFAMMLPPKVAKVDSDNKNHLYVEISYEVRTDTGQDAGHKSTTYNLNLDPTQLQQVDTNGLSYSDTLELKPGSYELRLVVRDNLNGQIGSVRAPLDLK